MYLQESKKLRDRIQAMMPENTQVIAKYAKRPGEAIVELRRFGLNKQDMKDLISLCDKLDAEMTMRMYWIRIEALCN